MAIKIQLRRGTAAQWTSANPVLMEGEMGVETDTLKVKLGNGSSTWTALPYFTQGMKGDTGATGATGPTGLTGAKGDKGDTGNPGPANTLTVGTVITGAAGSPATVTITGDSPNQTISFQIPQGVQGIQGIQGPQGVGVPTGGTEGQIIVKTVDGTAWVDNVVPQVKYTVRNTTGSTIPKGSVVYISGSNGTNILISLADADTEATSSKTVGIVETDIANNAFGYVVTEGLLAGLNTSGATAGDSVWLSSTAGAFVFGAPPAKPAHSVYLGVVSRVNSSNGEIFVKVQNGYELDELHDVQIVSPQDKQVLAYEGGLWKNKVASGGVTVSEPAPSSPIDGDGWFYSTDGTLFVRYNDGTSTQWVQPNAVLSSQIEQRYYSPNYIINGAFDIWQRGTSFSNPSAASYTADRFNQNWNGSGATRTISREGLNGNEITGLNAQYFYRYNQTVAGTGGSYNYVLMQPIEDVRSLAGQTTTVSFWARSTTSSAFTISLDQSFGSGGSSYLSTSFGNVSLSSSWQRYSLTGVVPSVSGKTIGANSYLLLVVRAAANAVINIDLAGVQVEEGSTATAFRRNANSLQGELAACQRYYWRAGGQSNYQQFASGIAQSTTLVQAFVQNPVPMRTAPTSVEFSSLGVTDSVTTIAVTNVSLGSAGSHGSAVNFTVASGLTAYRPYLPNANNSTSAYLGFSAEL